jgi:hypothetical protein
MPACACGRQANARCHERSDGWLLNRSFQTTYNTFRPASILKMQSDSLSLVDSHALENELLLNEITARFRAEAEEQIRDLNIRIALLFSQEKSANERILPAIFQSPAHRQRVEKFELDDDISAAVIAQIAEDLTPHIGKIYDAVNNYFAARGSGTTVKNQENTARCNESSSPCSRPCSACRATTQPSRPPEDAMPGRHASTSFSGNEGLPSPAYPAQQLQAAPAAAGQQSRTIIQQRAGSRGWKRQQNRFSNAAIPQQLVQQAASAFTSQPGRCAISGLTDTPRRWQTQVRTRRMHFNGWKKSIRRLDLTTVIRWWQRHKRYDQRHNKSTATPAIVLTAAIAPICGKHLCFTPNGSRSDRRVHHQAQSKLQPIISHPAY